MGKGNLRHQNLLHGTCVKLEYRYIGLVLYTDNALWSESWLNFAP